MKTIALIPPKPVLNIPRRKLDIAVCYSCDKPLTATGECRGCSD